MKTTASGRRSTCAVAAGTLADPYTGTSIRWTTSHAMAVQLDHIVPLSLAYDLGAYRWTPAERAAYANDETHVLIVASGPENEAKNSSGPSQWDPPNTAVRCAYDIRFTQVLHRYSLAITKADKNAIRHVLEHCHPAG